MTKRDIYYSDPGLFECQETVDRLINKIAIVLNVPRCRLGVVASPKGLAYGYLRVNGVSFLSSHVPALAIIPPNSSESMMDFPQHVLIIEKEAVFNSILQVYDRLAELIPQLLIVTGKGFPDLNTCQFVHWLWKVGNCQDIRVLVDFDPYGLDIALSYRVGSRAVPADKSLSCCPSCRFMGVTLAQIDEYSNRQVGIKAPVRQMMRPTPRLLSRLDRIVREAKAMGWDDLQKTGRDMMSCQFTVEIESLYNNNLDLLLDLLHQNFSLQ